jgi:hypothetical protein
MKTLPILFIFLFSFTHITFAQETDAEKLQQAIESKTFEFVVHQASGMRGRTIQLTSGYTLDMNPEKVKADLPFFGRAYSATPGSTDGGIKFEFTDYAYKIKPRKKGGWDITIEPSEPNDVRFVYLTIQKTGNASLRITSNNKEGMSYSGVVNVND